MTSVRSSTHCSVALAAAAGAVSILILARVTTAAPGEDPCDVLLVERPAGLVIFSKYQQLLPSEESRRLPPFVPMAIIREHDLLGDGITPCAAVEINGEPYYLQRESDGAFSRQGETGSVRLLRAVTFIGDSVALLRADALRLRRAGGEQEQTLSAGTGAVRLFRYDGSTFVRLSGDIFGWLVLPTSQGGTMWKPIHPAGGSAITMNAVRERVEPLVKEANRTLRRIYTGLSSESATRRLPPSFLLLDDGYTIRCSIAPQALAGSFAGSLRALLPGIERSLAGTGIRPVIAGDTIVIPSR